MQIELLDPRSHLIQTACTPPSMAAQQQEEDGLTALPSLQLKTTYMPDDDSARPTSGRTIAQQMEEEMAVEKELSALQLEDTVDRFLPEQQVNDFRQKPETEMRNDSSYREEPLTKPEMEISLNRLCDKEDLEHDDASERRNRKGKTETDAKAGVTRHLSRYPDGTSERVTNAVDAKVGQTQHSPVERLHRSLQHLKNELVDGGNRDKETGQHLRND